VRHRESRTTLLVVVAAVSAVLGGGIGGAIGYRAAYRTVGAATSPGTTLATAPPVPVNHPVGSVARVAAAVLPSVVSIVVTSASGEDSGSGIVLTKSGYILTNDHVVSPATPGAGNILVTLPSQPTVNVTAGVVGDDPKSDLAVLKVSGVRALTPAVLGNSDVLAVGDPVVAIGSPLGLAGTVTTGVVSALNRPVLPNGENANQPVSALDAIQTDAPINPGNSGGALVDEAGQVIGVNTAIATLGSQSGFSSGQSGSIGLGFAIPINYARSIAQQLIRTGHAVHPLMGVDVYAAGQCPNGGPSLPADRNGALVCRVIARSPAARAGLQPGDVIVALDAEPVTSADTLVAYTRVQAIGSTHTVAFIRNGRLMRVRVTLVSDG
jgi:putative serine protease PepD